MKKKFILLTIFIVLAIVVLLLNSCTNQIIETQDTKKVDEDIVQEEKEDIGETKEEPKKDKDEKTHLTESISKPDTIFFNGIVLTMNNDQPQAQAIAIKDGKILSVGSDEQILATQDIKTSIIDLQQLTLIPGFIDAHNHMFVSQEMHESDILGHMEAVQVEAMRYGITATGEMGVNDHQAAYIIDLDAKGKLFLRTNIYLVHHDPCGEPMGDWWKAYSPGYEYSENLKVGGIKIWADGGSCNVPAVSFEFPDGIGYGDLYFTHEELSQIVADLDKQGYQVAIHTAGDRSLELIQDVYNDVLGDKSNAIYHRIEHNAVIRPELLENYPETGVVLTVFGSFPTCAKISDEFHFKFDVPDEYQTWEWPWRDLLDANTNLPIAWHTDWPLTTFDTMQQLYGFTTRKQIAEDGSICEPTPDIASGIINREEALRIMTIGGAYALAREDEVGSLEPGKYADIVILSDNPLKILPDDLLDIEVYMTMIGGQVMYCAEGQESLCP